MRFTPRLEATLAQILVDRPEPVGALVPSLRAVQKATGWVSDRALAEIAVRLGLEVDDVANIAGYFGIARTQPAARHTLEVCVNVFCRKQGSEAVLDRLRRRLGVEPGEVSSDGAYALVEVICLRRCGSGPALRIDGEVRDGVGIDAIDALLADLDS
jgi:NADH:ubiquinone oxidoreductase subunit E